MRIEKHKKQIEIHWGFFYMKLEFRTPRNEPYYIGIGLVTQKDRAAWTKEVSEVVGNPARQHPSRKVDAVRSSGERFYRRGE